MFLDEFEKLLKQHKQGIKKILYRTKSPEIDKKSYEFVLNERAHNYDLNFDETGRLVESIHYDKPFPYKMIYGYRIFRDLLASTKLDSRNHQLLELTKYFYDSEGRISKEVNWNFYGNYKWSHKDEVIHSYTKDSHFMYMPKSKTSDTEATFIEIHNDKNQLIEKKAFRTPEDLIWWERLEYNQEGNLIKVISLDEFGIEDGITEFFPKSNDLETGYKKYTNNEEFIREFHYEFDKRGNWINKVTIGNGILQDVVGREISYYDSS